MRMPRFLLLEDLFAVDAAVGGFWTGGLLAAAVSRVTLLFFVPSAAVDLKPVLGLFVYGSLSEESDMSF